MSKYRKKIITGIIFCTLFFILLIGVQILNKILIDKSEQGYKTFKTADAQMTYTMGQCEDFVWPVDVLLGENSAILKIKKGSWLFSLPLDADINAGIFNRVWRFDSSEEQYKILKENQKLQPCEGYWIYTDRNIEIEIKGRILTHCEKRVKQGWHLIGGCSYPAEIMSCNGTIGDIFAFIEKTGYIFIKYRKCIYPGQGYWVYYEPDKEIGNICIR